MNTDLHDQQVDLHRKISGVNWNQVYYFSLVATYGSIKNASEVLKISSSTLSEHISLLENSLGILLFHRKGPKLTLTEAGQKLLWHAKQMFESGQRILDSVAPLALGSYPISIGVVPGPHLPMAHQFIAEYSSRFGPFNMKIAQWSFEELESRIASARLDFGFADRPSKRKDLVSHCLSTSHIRFYVSAKWSKHSLRDALKEIPLLVCQSAASTDAFIEKALDRVDIHPSSVIRAEYPSVLYDLCRNGLGAGAFCEDAMDPYLKGGLRALQNPKDAPKIESRTYLIWATGAGTTETISHVKQLLK